MSVFGAVLGLVLIVSGIAWMLGFKEKAKSWMATVILLAVFGGCLLSAASTIITAMFRHKVVALAIIGLVLFVLVVVAKNRVEKKLSSVKSAFPPPPTSAKTRLDREEF